jgi:hypothetical protein
MQIVLAKRLRARVLHLPAQPGVDPLPLLGVQALSLHHRADRVRVGRSRFAFCLLWAVLSLVPCCHAASVGFMAQLVSPDRKGLAVYPVFLFYVYISWMILVQ